MSKLEKNTLTFAGILIFTGIILGALRAHALKEILSEKALESFKTGVFYQLTQGLGLLLLVLVQKAYNFKFKLVFRLISIGVLMFSGSIYILSYSENINLGIFKFILGPTTPIGGLLMITGWLIFVIKMMKSTEKP